MKNFINEDCIAQFTLNFEAIYGYCVNNNS